MAESLGRELKQTVVIENVPGGGGKAYSVSNLGDLTNAFNSILQDVIKTKLQVGQIPLTFKKYHPLVPDGGMISPEAWMETAHWLKGELDKQYNRTTVEG